MEPFRRLFGTLLVLVYHCFDRIVIQGYLPLRRVLTHTGACQPIGGSRSSFLVRMKKR